MNKQIKQMRTDAGMSREELAKKLYVSMSAITTFEQDGYENFSISTLKKIADIFGKRLFVGFEEQDK